MRPLLSLVIAFMALYLGSCNQQIKQERIQRIDSLNAELAAVSASLATIDSGLLVSRMDDISLTKAWVFDNITDTLDRSSGMAFGDFIRTEKYLRQSLSMFNAAQKEKRMSQTQLSNLKKDVTENFYSDEEFRGYFNTESESILNLVDLAEDARSNYESSTERYNKFKPLVVSLTDSIKQVIYNATPIAR